MSAKKLIPTVLLVIITSLSFGQNSLQEEKTASREEASKAKPQTIDINDGYMGKKPHILRRLTVSEIPANFPKYNESLSKEQYFTLMKEWSIANKNLIKEEFQHELENRSKQ